MEKNYSLIGPNLFVNDQGQLFTKIAQEYKVVKNKITDAEDRFVERHLKRGASANDKD